MLKREMKNWIEHPREVKVDVASGKAFVTGRFFVSAIDLKTHKVEKIKVGGDEEGKRYISMNTTIHNGKLLRSRAHHRAKSM